MIELTVLKRVESSKSCILKTGFANEPDAGEMCTFQKFRTVEFGAPLEYDIIEFGCAANLTSLKETGPPVNFAFSKSA